MRRRLLLFVSMWCAWSIASHGCLAQTQRRVPDALILVQPSGNLAYISVTFSGYVPRERVNAALSRLQGSTGWELGAVEVRDVDGASGKAAKKGQRAGVLTEATALLSNAPQIRERSFVLQPYVDAFADWDRFDILFMIGADPAFQGLRTYRSPALDVVLVQDGAPFRYAVDVKDHTRPLPRLPLTEPVVQAPQPQKDAGRPASLVRQLAAVVLCAAVVALVAFVAAGRMFGRGERPVSRGG